MKIPKGLQPLIDDSVIDEVVHSLKNGREAIVYVVRSGPTFDARRRSTAVSGAATTPGIPHER